MLLAVLGESELLVSNDMVEMIVEKVLNIVNLFFFYFFTYPFCFLDNVLVQTMVEADSDGDGKIDEEEWREFVKNNPSVLKNMTLPYLK